MKGKKLGARKRCCNEGCDGPVQPPSLVLCKECLEKLGKKIAALSKQFDQAMVK